MLPGGFFHQVVQALDDGADAQLFAVLVDQEGAGGVQFGGGVGDVDEVGEVDAVLHGRRGGGGVLFGQALEGAGTDAGEAVVCAEQGALHVFGHGVGLRPEVAVGGAEVMGGVGQHADVGEQFAADID